MRLLPLVAAAALAGALPQPAASCQPQVGSAAFPVRAVPGQRWLSDAAGAPFLIQGDSPWSLIADLRLEDAEAYLVKRRAQGFNTILVNLIEHRFARNAPANAYGERPFLVDGDFTTPNPAYFDRAERVIERACDLGFLILLAPSYAGYAGEIDGWYKEMVQNGPDVLERYGRFLGERLGRFDNIIWVQGGDYDPPDKDLVRAIIAGIDSADPNAVHTAHGAPETRPRLYWAGEPWLSIGNVYTYDEVDKAARDEYLSNGGGPFFLMESAYEHEHGTEAPRVRRQAWQAVLSGASGQVYGNNPIWHFDGPGLYATNARWRDELDSPGARSMSILGTFLAGKSWWRLVPDTHNTLLRWNWGWNWDWLTERAVAAIADDGSFGLVYVPTRASLHLDLRQIRAPVIAAEWFDPSSGESRPVAGAPFVPGRAAIQTPGQNAEGAEDWVLVMTAASVTAATP